MAPLKHQAIKNKTLLLFNQIAKVMQPPPLLKVSEWADAYRRLSPEASAEPGRWNTDRAPYQRAIMDALNDSRTEEIVVMSSAQVGKTEIVLNILGYYIDYDPSPILIMQPTDGMAQAFSKDRIAPMIRDTPALTKKVRDAKSRDSENTILHKKFPGGHVTIVGANAAAGLASRPIKVLLCDEVDRYPASAGTEGDPVNLAKKRTTTFWNRKKIYVSTPTIKGMSRIEQEYNSSTMEQWCVACPCCGTYQPYEWNRIKFGDVTMECLSCRESFVETEWKGQPGKWIARNTKAEKRGFHLNEMASPWKRWDDIIKDFKEANKKYKETRSTQQLQVFINTSLGEAWELKGDGVEEDSILSRREKYECDMPDEVVVLTAGVDVQDNRFEIEVVGWAQGYESWGIQYHTIYCDPEKDTSWEALEEWLEKEFYFKNGNSLLIAATCIDTGGHFTDKCYGFLKKMDKKQKRIYGIKGIGGPGYALIHKQSRNTKNGVRIFIVGVDQGKELIMSRLNTKEKGPGYCHFPLNRERNYDEIYMKGLTSEKRVVTTNKKGETKLEWIKKSGTRNEPLDLRNYATAAAQILNPNWEKLKKKLEDGINYMKRAPKPKGVERKRGAINRGVDV
ncbi:MAG: phage terminase large subunit family protein [Cellulosilyticaceae bacterium]